MRLTIVLCAVLALASCTSDHPSVGLVGGSIAGGPLSPTTLIGTRIAPQRLPVGLGGSQFCPFAPVFSPFAPVFSPFAPPFTTAFDLIVQSGSTTGLFMDNVTLRLVDGTHAGPSMSFPRAELDRMFGSTLIVGTRGFPFQPNFGCVSITPTSLIADLVFVDSFGTFFRLNTTGLFGPTIR